MLFNFVTIVAFASSTYAIKAPSAFPRSALDSIWRRQEDQQKSLTLDPKVIAKGFAQDGNPNEGQVPSLTSENNFINFCLTQQDVPLTDGKQVEGGSCNQVPMGRIAGNNKMPRSKFVFPPNLDDSLVENTKFTIKMKIVNIVTGNFVNAKTNYFAAPQFTNDDGVIVGHSHVTVQSLPTGFQHSEPLDPTNFAFFKGVNNPADNEGIVAVDVVSGDATKPDGLPAGQYRLCSINAAANHQPVLVARAQRGWNDDCVYFTVNPANGGNGGNNDGGNNDGGNNDGGNNDGGNNDGGNNDGGNNDGGNNDGGNNDGGNNDGGNNDGGNNDGGNNDGGNNDGGNNDGENNDGGNNDGGNNGDNNGDNNDQGNNNDDGQNNNDNGQNGNGGNLQTFNGQLGAPAPAVTQDGDRFNVDGQTFNDVQSAVEASCNSQRNQCADAANRTGGRDGVNIPACDDQRDQCMASNAPQGLGTENLNKFKGSRGNAEPVSIASTQNGGCFTDGVTLPSLGDCVQRACNAQRNRCADNRNAQGRGIGACDRQRDECLRQ